MCKPIPATLQIPSDLDFATSLWGMIHMNDPYMVEAAADEEPMDKVEKVASCADVPKEGEKAEDETMEGTTSCAAVPNEGEKAEDETMEGTTSCADVPKEDEKGKHEDTEGTTEATEEYEEVKEEVIKEEPEEEEWTQEQWAEWNAWYDEHIDEEMEEAAMAAEESEVEWVSWPPPPPASILPKATPVQMPPLPPPAHPLRSQQPKSRSRWNPRTSGGMGPRPHGHTTTRS